MSILNLKNGGNKTIYPLGRLLNIRPENLDYSITTNFETGQVFLGNEIIEDIFNSLKTILETAKNDYGLDSSNINDYSSLPIGLAFEYNTLFEILHKYENIGYGLLINKDKELFKNKKNYLPLKLLNSFAIRGLMLGGFYTSYLLYIPDEIYSLYKTKLQIIAIPFSILKYVFLMFDDDNSFDLIGRLLTIDIQNKEVYNDWGNNLYETNQKIKNIINSLNSLGITNSKDIKNKVMGNRLQIVFKNYTSYIVPHYTYVYLPETVHLHLWGYKYELPLNPLWWFFKNGADILKFLGFTSKREDFTDNFNNTIKKLLKTNSDNIDNIVGAGNVINIQLIEVDILKHTPYSQSDPLYGYIPIFIPKYLFIDYEEYNNLLTGKILKTMDYDSDIDFRFKRFNFQNNDWEDVIYNPKNAGKSLHQFLIDEGMNYDEILLIPFDKLGELNVNTGNPENPMVLYISNHLPLYLVKIFNLDYDFLYVYEEDLLRNHTYQHFPQNIFSGKIL